MVKNSNATGRRSIPMAVRAAQMSRTGTEKQIRHSWEQIHFPWTGRYGWKRCPDCLGRTMISVLTGRDAKYRDADANLTVEIEVLEVGRVCDTCDGTGEVKRRPPGNKVDPNSRRQRTLARRRGEE